jgi:predicted DNA-binding transcriptional regulator AlpA
VAGKDQFHRGTTVHERIYTVYKFLLTYPHISGLYTFVKNTKKTQEEEYKTGPEIARILALDPATIRRYARSEGMPQHVLGEGLVRYRLAEVLAWLAQRQRRPRKPPGEAAGRTKGQTLELSGSK